MVLEGSEVFLYRGKHHCENRICLWHYVKHVAHLQNFSHLGVIIGASVMLKGKVRMGKCRMISECDACVLVAVPAGFPLGLLQDV